MPRRYKLHTGEIKIKYGFFKNNKKFRKAILNRKNPFVVEGVMPEKNSGIWSKDPKIWLLFNG